MTKREEDAMTHKIKNLILCLIFLPLVGGCSSIAEGVTKGLMADSVDRFF